MPRTTMSQQQDDRSDDLRPSSQTSEKEEIYSDRATSGSSDPGSDRLDSAPALSRSSGRAHDGPMTRGLLQGVQTSRASNQDTTRGTQGLSTVDSGSLRGLTPAPLPPDILPSKKRTLGEVLRDESPPRKDKLSAEIDQLYGEGTSHSRSSSAGPSNARDAPTPRSHRHKKRDRKSVV